jgi:hypothetical protein
LSEFYRVGGLICSPAGFAFHTYERENLQVGVLAPFPNAPLIDGILGGSLLKDFTMTLDYAIRRLRLVLKEPVPTPPPTPSLTLATMREDVFYDLQCQH